MFTCKAMRRVWCLLACIHTAFLFFLMYNCSWSSIMYGHFINFAVSDFNTENDNLHFITFVASVSL